MGWLKNSFSDMRFGFTLTQAHAVAVGGFHPVVPLGTNRAMAHLPTRLARSLRDTGNVSPSAGVELDAPSKYICTRQRIRHLQGSLRRNARKSPRWPVIVFLLDAEKRWLSRRRRRQDYHWTIRTLHGRLVQRRD